MLLSLQLTTKNKTIGSIMKKIFLLVSLLVTFTTIGLAQNNQEEEAIKQTAYDYAEGYYSADAARMENALYPDLNKATPVVNQITGKIFLGYSTYSGLIEATRAKSGLLDPDKRKMSFHLININEDVANAKILTARFDDYLQMVKVEGRWKIINVLFAGGSDIPPAIKDFNAEVEKEVVAKTVKTYYDAMTGGDARALELVAHPEINRVNYSISAETGKVRFNKTRYSSLIENVYSKVNVVDEEKRNVEIKVLDVMKGLAVVEIFTGNSWEYLQLFKEGLQWKVFNTITKPNPNFSFSASLPALVGLPMQDFTLPIYSGGEFTLSKNKGKNVLLVFPRGAVANGWCTICQYQYVDFSMKEKLNNFRKKYDIEIVFVLPFTKDRTDEYLYAIPDAVAKVEQWKNPATGATVRQKELAELVRKIMPQKYEVKKGEVPNNLPILLDADKKVSKSLKIFTTNWDQSRAEQNIPTIYIIDKKGNLAFKYHSQTTFDRLSLEYLIEFIDNM